MIKSECPRTDAIIESQEKSTNSDENFARQLERELAEARTMQQVQNNTIDDLIKERDQLRADNGILKAELTKEEAQRRMELDEAEKQITQLRAEVERMTKIASVAETRLVFTERERNQWRECCDYLASELKKHGAGFLNGALKSYEQLKKGTA